MFEYLEDEETGSKICIQITAANQESGSVHVIR